MALWQPWKWALPCIVSGRTRQRPSCRKLSTRQLCNRFTEALAHSIGPSSLVDTLASELVSARFQSHGLLSFGSKCQSMKLGVLGDASAQDQETIWKRCSSHSRKSVLQQRIGTGKPGATSDSRRTRRRSSHLHKRKEDGWSQSRPRCQSEEEIHINQTGDDWANVRVTGVRRGRAADLEETTLVPELVGSEYDFFHHLENGFLDHGSSWCHLWCRDGGQTTRSRVYDLSRREGTSEFLRWHVQDKTNWKHHRYQDTRMMTWGSVICGRRKQRRRLSQNCRRRWSESPGTRCGVTNLWNERLKICAMLSLTSSTNGRKVEKSSGYFPSNRHCVTRQSCPSPYRSEY